VQDPKPSAASPAAGPAGPAAPAQAPSASPPPASTATEVVTRPDPGLARGRWEAPRGVFYGAIALVVVVGGLALLSRLGVLASLRLRVAPRTGK